MKLTVLVNSQKRNSISVFDRGFQFGDGLFESMKLEGDKLFLWQEHYQRLLQGCEVLNIGKPEEDKLLRQFTKAIKISKIKKEENAVLKLILTRGNSLRGYAYDEGLKANIIIFVLPYVKDETVELCLDFCKNILVETPALAGIKHCNRLEQILLSPSCENCIALDERKRVICASASNLFLIEKNTFSTPDLSRCGIEGTARSKILELIPQLKMQVRIEDIMEQRLLAADAVFSCNSLFGIKAVSKIGYRQYAPSPLLRTLQQAYEEDIRKNAKISVKNELCRRMNVYIMTLLFYHFHKFF